MKKSDVQLVSIGKLSAATGVPPNTIRTWEKRYGFPKPTRLASGHRRYDPLLIEHIQLISMALEQDHRPAQIMKMDFQQLKQLVQPTCHHTTETSTQNPWMNYVIEFQEEKLNQVITNTYKSMDILAWLERHLVPFVQSVGEMWADGQITVYHEQFASRVIIKFFQKILPELKGKHGDNRGRALLCTLPGEYHMIGVYMATCVLAATGWDFHIAQADQTLRQIAHDASHEHHDIIMISISNAANTRATQRHLETLSQMTTIPIIIGGQGAPSQLDGIDGIKRIKHLQQLFEWTQNTQIA